MNSFICTNTSPAVKVFAGFSAEGLPEWKFNIPVYDAQGNIVFDPWKRVMANFILPISQLNAYNPYRKTETVPYCTLQEMYAHLVRYQDFVSSVCVDCGTSAAFEVRQYVDLVDEYRYMDGDFLLSYCSSIFFSGQRYCRPLKSAQPSFLDAALSACSSSTVYPLDFTSDYTLLTMLGSQEAVDDFMFRYVSGSGKMDAVAETVTAYVMAKNSAVVLNMKDVLSEVSAVVMETVRSAGLALYVSYAGNPEEKIPAYTSYQYSAESPVLSIPLLIDASFEDAGIGFSAVSGWVSGSRYYAGDTVVYGENTYVLKDSTESPLPVDDYGFSYFCGALNEKEGVIYFDDIEVDANGYTVAVKVTDYGYTHWTSNVKNAFSSSVKPVIEARTSSRISMLKSYRAQQSYINFWDTEGAYRPGVYFGQQSFTDASGVKTEYRSYIFHVYRKDTPDDGVPKFYFDTLDITDSVSEREKIQKYVDVFGFDIMETGHDFVLYLYVIDEKAVGDVTVESDSYSYVECYHRYRTEVSGDNKYSYDFEGWTSVTFHTGNGNTAENMGSPDTVDGVYVKGEAAMLNYAPQSKIEYENGIVFPAKVESDVFIDRGVNYAFAPHYKLSECKSLEQIIRHANGGTFAVRKI
jgi:hypothetical protein